VTQLDLAVGFAHLREGITAVDHWREVAGLSHRDIDEHQMAADGRHMAEAPAASRAASATDLTCPKGQLAGAAPDR